MTTEDLGYGPPTHRKGLDMDVSEKLDELKKSMRKASMGYRRASMELRKASLCHSYGSYSTSSTHNTLKFQPRRGSQDSTVSALTVDKAISDQAIIDAAMPWEYDLEYGWLTSSAEAGGAVAVEEQKLETVTDKDGNISELSFKNRRASIEYRRASMAFRRASGDTRSRRGSMRASRQESDYENTQQHHFYCSGGMDGSAGSAGNVSTLDPSDAPAYGVFFGEVEIFEFPVIIGDNPACTGCPTTLDWKPVSHRVEDFMMHEFVRGPRRTRKQLKVSKEDQYFFLMKSGYSMETIIATEEECQKIRTQRYETLKAERQFDAFTKVFARAKGNLEQSIKEGTKAVDLRSIVPNSIEKMGQMGHQVSEAVNSTANFIVSPFAKVGQRMSSAVQKTTSRMSIARKPQQPALGT